MHGDNYLYVTGVIRALEAKRISQENFQRLFSAKTLQKAIGILKDLPDQEYFVGPDPQAGFANILIQRRTWLFHFIDTYAPPINLSALFKLGLDFHNIKVLLKNRILERRQFTPLSNFGSYPVQVLQEIMQREQYDLLDPVMEKGIMHAVETYYQHKFILTIDLVLDMALYENLLRLAQIIKSEYILNYFRLYINLINLQTMARAAEVRNVKELNKLLFLKGGTLDEELLYDTKINTIEQVSLIADKMGYGLIKEALQDTSNPFCLERACDEILLEYLRQANFYIDGIEPLFAFAVYMEMETKTLGIILSGLKTDMDKLWLKRRIPDLYR